MTRKLLLPQSPLLSTPLQSGPAAMTLLLCAFALLACASHSLKWRRRWRAHYSHEPVIQLNHEDTMLATSGSHDEGMVSGEQPVWQKNILMGGKCQLPDFSGVILYDSDGNVVTPAKGPRLLLTWK